MVQMRPTLNWFTLVTNKLLQMLVSTCVRIEIVTDVAQKWKPAELYT